MRNNSKSDQKRKTFFGIGIGPTQWLKCCSKELISNIFSFNVDLKGLERKIFVQFAPCTDFPSVWLTFVLFSAMELFIYLEVIQYICNIFFLDNYVLQHFLLQWLNVLRESREFLSSCFWQQLINSTEKAASVFFRRFSFQPNKKKYFEILCEFCRICEGHWCPRGESRINFAAGWSGWTGDPLCKSDIK